MMYFNKIGSDILIDNRILNGGFETGVLTPFLGNGSGVTIYSSASHSGAYSARLTGGTGRYILSQLVQVSPGENFEFLISLSKLGSYTSPPISIVISYLDSGSNLLAIALATNIQSGRLSNNWMEIYMTTIVAPNGTTQARIDITKQSRLNSATIVVDDVALIAVGNSGNNGDLIVDGNATIRGDLTINGNTRLGNDETDRVLAFGNFEAFSNARFYGGLNIFSHSVFIDENLSVAGSDIIGSGSINSRTLSLDGSEMTTETLSVNYGNIQILGAGFGIILTAPNNTHWLITVDDNGNLTTTFVS